MAGEHAVFAQQGMESTPPIEAAVDIAASAGDVWEAISERGNLTNVHPFCETNEVERWPGPGSLDHVHYYGGVHYQRDVGDWREGLGYQMIVGPPSGKIATADWWIEATDERACRFGIEVTSYVRSAMDPAKRERYEAEVIRGAIPPYLDSVVRGVAHYVETGDPVVRNQFGAHPIYSPEVS